MKPSVHQIQKTIVISLKIGSTIFILGGLILASGFFTISVAQQHLKGQRIPPAYRHGLQMYRNTSSDNHYREHLLLSNTLNPQWETNLGLGTSPGTDQISDMVTDKNGNIYITGLSSAQPFGTDYLIQKYDAGGYLAWEARFKGNGPGDNEPEAIAVDAKQNVVVSGLAYNPATECYNITTVYYNSQGKEQWSAVIPDSIAATNTTDINNVATVGFDGNGDVYVAGSLLTNRVSPLYVTTDLLTVKYDGTDGHRLWKDLYDGGKRKNDMAAAMVVDSAGNVWVTGASDTTVTGYCCGSDFLTIKYKPDGKRQWIARYGDGNEDAADAIAMDPQGDVYVTGYDRYRYGDYLTIKYDSTGKKLWEKKLSGPNGEDNYATDIAVDHNGSVLVTGSTSQDGFDYDFLTAKYSSTGDSIWAKTYNGPANGNDGANGLAVDAQDNVYVTGYIDTTAGYGYYKITTLKYDSTGVLKWSKPQIPASGLDWSGNYSDISKIVIDNNGHQILTACTNNHTTTGDDFAITSYSTDGNVNWQQNFDGGPASYDPAVKMVQDTSGNTYIAGFSYMGIAVNNHSPDWYNDDIFAAKFDPDGKLVWSKSTDGGNMEDDHASGLAVDANGNVYVCGYTTSANGLNFLTVKYNAQGDSVWTKTYNGPANLDDEAEAITVDKDNNIIVTGSRIDNNRGNKKSALVTIKYDPAGNVLWTASHQILTNSIPYHILSDASGDIYVCGATIPSGSTWTPMLVKYNSSGDTLWTLTGKDFPDISTVSVYLDGMVQDADGNIYALGSDDQVNAFLVKVNSNGDTLWTRTEKNNGIWNLLTIDNNNNLYIAGSPNTYVKNSPSIIKYDANGNKLWSKSPGITIKAIATDANGNVFGTGPGQGKSGGFSTNYLTMEYQSNGTLKWTGQYDVAALANKPVGISVDSDDNVTVVGNTSSKYGYWSAVNILRYNQTATPIAKEPVAATPVSFRLSQNYPNPFNPTTTIRYSLAQPARVTLTVFNILGQKVATLVSRYQNAGAYNYIWKADGFASGMYLYRLKAGNTVLTKKMLLLK